MAATFLRAGHAHCREEEGVRDAMLAIIQADPGVHIQRLAALLGIQHASARYHLQKLVRQGAVSVRPLGGRLACFDRTAGRVAGKDAHAILHEPSMRETACAILEDPGPIQDLAARLEIATKVALRRVARLEAAGLAQTVPGTRKEVYPSTELDQALRMELEGEELEVAFDELGFA